MRRTTPFRRHHWYAHKAKFIDVSIFFYETFAQRSQTYYPVCYGRYRTHRAALRQKGTFCKCTASIRKAFEIPADWNMYLIGFYVVRRSVSSCSLWWHVTFVCTFDLNKDKKKKYPPNNACWVRPPVRAYSHRFIYWIYVRATRVPCRALVTLPNNVNARSARTVFCPKRPTNIKSFVFTNWCVRLYVLFCEKEYHFISAQFKLRAPKNSNGLPNCLKQFVLSTKT